METSVGALLLAAGFSKRFGDTKLFAKLNNGDAVLAQTYKRLQAALDEVAVVTRPELEQEISNLAAPPLICNQSDKGMGASLAFGIAQVASMGWDACLICLADMPFIQQSTYEQLAAAADPDKIIVPCYENKIGNPVVFGRKFFPELVNVSGDAGGRPIVRRYPEQLIKVAINDPAILADIDTPDELKQLQQSFT